MTPYERIALQGAFRLLTDRGYRRNVAALRVAQLWAAGSILEMHARGSARAGWLWAGPSA